MTGQSINHMSVWGWISRSYKDRSRTLAHLVPPPPAVIHAISDLGQIHNCFGIVWAGRECNPVSRQSSKTG